MHPRLFLAALLGTAIGALHQTLVGTGSPNVVEDLGGADLYTLVPVAYLVATALGALAALSLGRHRSMGTLLVIGMVAFSAGAGAAATSGAMWQLVVARGLAGLGAGVVFVVAVASADLDGRRHALVAAVFGGALAIGPLAGDALTHLSGWRSAFLLTLPFAIAVLVFAVVAGRSRVRTTPEPHHDLRPDASPAARPDLRPASRAGARPAARAASRAGARPRLGERAVVVLAGALAAAAVFVAFVFLPAASSIRAIGGDGVPVLAIPLAVSAIAGALIAPRLPFAAAGLDLIAGLVLLGAGLLMSGVAPSSGPGAWIISGLAGLGAGLALAGASRLIASASVSAAAAVASRQLGGLLGLAVAAAFLFTGLETRLVASLRPIIEAVLAEVPPAYRLFARGFADEALSKLGQALSAANVGGRGEGGMPQTFADIVIARIPGDFQALAIPYVQELNAVFSDALAAAFSSALTVGVLLTTAALAVGAAAARLDARRRQAVISAVGAADREDRPR